ncbi:MAG: A/G-specific adenine glycosylase, partial [Longimicrobiales bacterium]
MESHGTPPAEWTSESLELHVRWQVVERRRGVRQATAVGTAAACGSRVLHSPMRHLLSDADIAAIREALLAFFDSSARPLPWRSTRDPYAIWVSEVMAQQTRVETVVPYYERWLSRFPDVDALADAPLDDVLKAWEGLGYYDRARNLHAAARVLRERHECVVPDSYEALRALPGIGEYTAGAVSSIAFGVPRAAIDGNVRRVLARVLDQPAPLRPMLRDIAGSLVPADRPGDFNQALMELGAVVCTPKAPRCERCPISQQCGAHTAGTQDDRPRSAPRKRIPTVDLATAVLRDERRRLLIVRRPARGLLAGMWSFPARELSSGADPSVRALEAGCEYADVRGAPRAIGVIVHVFSHRRERYHCFAIDAAELHRLDADVAWIGDRDTRRALPRAQQRIRALAWNDYAIDRTAGTLTESAAPGGDVDDDHG